MSNRYVWNRFSLIAETDYSTDLSESPYSLEIDAEDAFWAWIYNGSYPMSEYDLRDGPVYIRYGTSYGFSNGKFTINGGLVATVPNGYTAPFIISPGVASYDYYIGFSKTAGTNSYDAIYRMRVSKSSSADDNPQIRFGVRSNNDTTPSLSAFYFVNDYSSSSQGWRLLPAKGSASGTVSNSGASTYPPRDYVSKSARIWPYSAPGMRGSGRVSTSMYPLLGAALTI